MDGLRRSANKAFLLVEFESIKNGLNLFQGGLSCIGLNNAVLKVAVMFFQAMQQQGSQAWFVRAVWQRAFLVELFEIMLFVGGPSKDFLFGHFPSANRFELLAILAEVDVSMRQDLFAFVEQSHDVICIFDVEAELVDEFAAFADWVLASEFVKRCVGVAFEFWPAAFMQKQTTILADQSTDRSNVKDAILSREQRVEHVRVSLHAQGKIANDPVDAQIVFGGMLIVETAVAYVCLLEVLKGMMRSSKACDPSIEMREDVILRWNANPVDVAVRCVRGNSIRNRSHHGFVNHVCRNKPWWLDQALGKQFLSYASHGI